jgi:hypothetical protein
VKRATSIVSVVTTVMAGRTAIQRLLQARDDGDRFELVDALLNVLVLVTGTIVIVRRLRRGEDEA